MKSQWRRPHLHPQSAPAAPRAVALDPGECGRRPQWFATRDLGTIGGNSPSRRRKFHRHRNHRRLDWAGIGVPLIPSCVWPRATAIRPARVVFLTPALRHCREPDLGRSSSASAWPPQMSLKHQSWSPGPRIQDAGAPICNRNAICLRLRGLTRPATSGRMASERSEGDRWGKSCITAIVAPRRQHCRGAAAYVWRRATVGLDGAALRTGTPRAKRSRGSNVYHDDAPPRRMLEPRLRRP